MRRRYYSSTNYARRAKIIYLSPCQNHYGSSVISSSMCSGNEDEYQVRQRPAMNISSYRDWKSMMFCISAFTAEGVPLRMHRVVNKDNFHEWMIRSTQLTCSPSRSSIWRSCTCSDVDSSNRPFSCSAASTSSPLPPPRCNSSQQLDSSEVEEQWDASSSDSKDDVE